MLNNRRNFLKAIPFIAASNSSLQQLNFLDNENVKIDNDNYWENIRKDFKIKPDYINLENGYYLMQSETVLNGFIKNVKIVNYEASYYMRTRQFDDKADVKAKLAEMAGCSAEELIITRNTTESLDTVIAGKTWSAGDEAIMAFQDYGAMLDMFKLQAKRYGMVNKVVSIPNNPQTDEELVRLYEEAISRKTKLILVSHMVNITGQIMPVRKICEMAHSKGIEVLVDGAHAFAHIDFKITDLNCDYYGTSLHKWLGCPLGAGFLYVKKDKIEKLWPVFGDMGYADTDIRKLNHTGTHPVHTDLTINNAIDFHHKIGIKRKESRMRFLQNYWTDPLRNIPNIIINTPEDKARSCGVANVGTANIKPAELAKILFNKYKIWTVAIDYANVQGVRITPHLYTTTAELDTFIKAMKGLAKG